MKNENQDHFVKLLLQTQTVLRTYILSLVTSFNDAEDLLQEVNTVLWEKSAQYDPNRSFVKWSLGIARLEVLHSRRDFARNPLCSNSALVDLIAEQYEQAAVEMDARLPYLRHCIDQLSETHREVVRLRYDQDLPLESISRQTGRSEVAVRIVLTRVRRALAECITRQARMREAHGS